MKIDLHCHTTASDGRFTPSQIIDRAVELNIGLLAITDHDTIDGLAPACDYIEQNQLNIKLISGIEFSTIWYNNNIHIVGLGVDPNNETLSALIEQQKINRAIRAEKIAERLQKVTREGVYEEVKTMVGEGSITRSHFAQWLVDNGYAKTPQAVFKKYLSRDKPGYVPPLWCSMSEAIDAIHQAGGQAVLAHPSRYNLTTKWIKRVIAAFSEAGGDAMEIAHPQQTQQERRTLADYAIQYGLLVSQGSDFHYISPWVELGRNLWLPSGVTPVWKEWELPFELTPAEESLMREPLLKKSSCEVINQDELSDYQNVDRHLQILES